MLDHNSELETDFKYYIFQFCRNSTDVFKTLININALKQEADIFDCTSQYDKVFLSIQ